jgi:hypothetical protein
MFYTIICCLGGLYLRQSFARTLGEIKIEFLKK